MAYLIDYEGRSLQDFYENTIMYLTFWGLGSVNEILNMKMTEIVPFKNSMKSEEMIKFRFTTLGVHTED